MANDRLSAWDAGRFARRQQPVMGAGGAAGATDMSSYSPTANYTIPIPRGNPIPPQQANQYRATVGNVANPTQNMQGNLSFMPQLGGNLQQAMAGQGDQLSRQYGDRNMADYNMFQSTEPLEAQLDRQTLAAQVGVGHADLTRFMENLARDRQFLTRQVPLLSKQFQNYLESQA